MARIEFDDSGRNYVEMRWTDGQVELILSARDGSNPLNNRVNSIKLTKKQFDELIKDVMN